MLKNVNGTFETKEGRETVLGQRRLKRHENNKMHDPRSQTRMKSVVKDIIGTSSQDLNKDYRLEKATWQKFNSC